jgi:hypothetical protein
MSHPPFTFIHPSNIMLAAPSQAGKTHFLVRALELGMFYPRPTRVVWVYGESQGDHERLDALTAQGKLPKVEFLRNETNYADIIEDFDPNETNLLILDDQMNEGKSNSRQFDNIFTKGSHHRNISVVLLIQNVFEKGFRTISLNAHYIVLFKSPRDQRQVQVLGSQMYPANPNFIRDVYIDATEQPHSYLLLDFHQETPDELRVKADVTAKSVRVYVPPSFTEQKH